MTIFLRKKESYFQAVRLEDIKYIEASSNYTVIVTNNEQFIISRTLKVVEKYIRELDTDEIFWRISRSVIINKSHVHKIAGNAVYVGDKSFTVSHTQRRNTRKHFVMMFAR
jgi:DNA-binding LytR/AlgR family response regulator